MSTQTFNIGGRQISLDFSTGRKADVMRQIREQDPDLYRQLFLGGSTAGVVAGATGAGAREIAEATSPLEAFTIGAGRTASNVASGAEMLGSRLFGTGERAEEIQAERAADQPAIEALREARPVSTFLGESAPYMAIPGGNVAGARTLFGAGKALAQEAAVGGATELIESGGDLGAAALSAGAGAVGALAGRGLFRRGAREAMPEVIKRAEDVGFRVSPSTRYPSAVSEWAERFVERRPLLFGAGGRRAREKNQRILNKGFREALGLPQNTNLTKKSLADVQKALMDDFVYPLRPSMRLAQRFQELANVRTSALSDTSSVAPTLKTLANRTRKETDPELVRNTLTELSRKIRRSTNASERGVLREAQNAIIEELGSQHGDEVGRLVNEFVDRFGLIETARESLVKSGRTGKEAINYNKIFTDYYKNKALPSNTDFGELLETGQRSGPWGLGSWPEDIRPTGEIPSGLLPSSAAAIGGFALGGLPGAIATEVGARALGEGVMKSTVPRIVSEGALGAFTGNRMSDLLGPAAARMGRGAGMLYADEEGY